MSRWPLAILFAALAGHALAADPAPTPAPAPPSPAATTAEPERPKAALRVLKFYDFTEPDNPEPMPRDFDRVFGPGFPEHNQAAFDTLASESGRSLKLPTIGGGTKVRVRRGEIPIFADADYAVSARLRTQGLNYAAAILSARLLDSDERPIVGAAFRTDPARTGGDWRTVSLTIPGTFPRAVWMELELAVEQPRQFTTSTATPAAAAHEIWREDISGAAWFDDIRIVQVPRSTLHLDADTDAVTAPARPVLLTSVRDLSGEELTAELTVADASGEVIARSRSRIDPGGRPLRWTPELTRLGWYLAKLRVESRSGIVAENAASFVWLAPAPEAGFPEAQRFGVAADDTPAPRVADVAPLLRALGTRFVTIPAWDPSLPPDAIADDVRRRGPAIERLLRDGHEITLALHEVPAVLASGLKLDADDPFALLSRPADTWAPYLRPILDAYGQRVVRYQLGPTGDDRAFFASDLAPRVAAVNAIIAELVPEPEMVLPWRIDQPLGPAADAGSAALTVFAPGSTDPDALRAFAAASAGAPPGRPLTLAAQLAQPRPHDRADELIKRAAAYWSGLGDDVSATYRFAVPTPWTWPTDAGERPSPSPEFAALRTAMARLGGRRVLAALPTPPGVRAWVLARRTPDGRLTDGAVVAWTDPGAPSEFILPVPSAGQPLRVIDAFGNEDDPKTVDPGARLSSAVDVRIDRHPVFIEGVDAALAVFIAGLKFTPTFVPAVMTRHEHSLRITNPWPVRITGRVQIRTAGDQGRGPGQWTIEPAGVVEFALGPGESDDLPYTLSVGPGQLAGIKNLSIVAKIVADREYDPVRVNAAVEIGLTDLELRPELQTGVGPDAAGLAVVSTVVNKSDRVRTLRLEVSSRGQPDQYVQINELRPGESIVRRIFIRPAADAPPARRVIVSLTDVEDGARLNKALDLP
jgi:hypothetical protein